MVYYIGSGVNWWDDSWCCLRSGQPRDHAESIVLSASYPGMSQEVVLHHDALDCFGRVK
jgi:hypothetical protein